SKRSSQQQQEEEEKPSSQSSESSSPSDCLPNLPVGSDSRLTFTDFLYTYLVQARIRTFRDDEELRKGHTIAPELIKAIHESKIGIPIFSPNCASSKWCNQGLILPSSGFGGGDAAAEGSNFAGREVELGIGGLS
ncbi:Disease resistance protein L6, partial [Linum perenne]